jgi:DNA-binding NtrC family response regulator
MDARGLLSVTLVRDEDGPVGILGIPRGRRRTPMNLEEVRAVRLLADRIGAVLGVSSALARSRAREMQLHRTADRCADEIDRLAHQLAIEGGRMREVAERLAQPLHAKVYSPAGTMALEQVRRTGAVGAPVTLLSPPGVDPVPWAAVAHLASARAQRPFVVVYATDASEQNLDRWRDPEVSPLHLANGGTLLVVDLPALDRAVQDFIAACLAERASPDLSAAVLDVVLSVSVPSTVDALVAAARLSTALADWLGDRALVIPPLSARAEDLRAIVLDKLARTGVRLRGDPFGIDDHALAQLMQHTWPGNDVELSDVLLRAALVADGPRITREQLDAIGFWPWSARDREPDVAAGEGMH